MQRIIKFRAWDGQKMLYPKDYNYIHFTEGCQSWEVFTEDEMHEYFIAATNGNHVDGLEDSALMQFTGLTDKNGREIYEGDILKEYYSRGYVYKVFSVQGGFAINTHQDDLAKDNIVFYNSLADMQNSGYINQCTEVIGNIYENPELCKG